MKRNLAARGTEYPAAHAIANRLAQDGTQSQLPIAHRTRRDHARAKIHGRAAAFRYALRFVRN